MRTAYASLTGAGVCTRHAAALTGLVRSTAIRRGNASAVVGARAAIDPANKLSPLERRRILEVLNSSRFVDLAPLQRNCQYLWFGRVQATSVRAVSAVGFGA
ncbi:hypothetical protein [Nocardia sp. NPDC059239]|uniref:hypothetical protein n=1 Tax=unclassified Nocardia TaxID=2637762 RepID=UPI0036C793F6